MPVVREQIVQAVVTAFGAEYGIPAPESERDLPVTIVADGADERADDQYHYTNLLMPVAVAKAELATDIDRDVMRSAAHDLLSSIISTMFADETFGGLADSVEYVGGGVQTEVGKFVFAEAQFTIRYHHVRGDPTTID